MKTIFAKSILACAFIMSFQLAKACDSPALIDKITQAETKKLLSNPPTFRHAWEDGKIKLSFTDASTDDTGCKAKMTLTLPDTDLNEINAYLDQNPAKRILLGAQGYSIPENTVTEIEYFYSKDGQPISSKEKIKPLNDLHHSLEYMYQSLAQLRLEISPDSKNVAAWANTYRQTSLEQCTSKLNATAGSIEQACQCRLEQLSVKLSDRQNELLDYLSDQPYSVATGSLSNAMKISSDANISCGLKKK